MLRRRRLRARRFRERRHLVFFIGMSAFTLMSDFLIGVPFRCTSSQRAFIRNSECAYQWIVL